MRLRLLHAQSLPEPSSLRLVHWIQLSIKAVTGACKLIDGCSLVLCSAIHQWYRLAYATEIAMNKLMTLWTSGVPVHQTVKLVLASGLGVWHWALMPCRLTQESISWPKDCMQSWNMFRTKCPSRGYCPFWQTCFGLVDFQIWLIFQMFIFSLTAREPDLVQSGTYHRTKIVQRFSVFAIENYKSACAWSTSYSLLIL